MAKKRTINVVDHEEQDGEITSITVNLSNLHEPPKDKVTVGAATKEEFTRLLILNKFGYI